MNSVEDEDTVCIFICQLRLLCKPVVFTSSNDSVDEEMEATALSGTKTLAEPATHGWLGSVRAGLLGSGLAC